MNEPLFTLPVLNDGDDKSSQLKNRIRKNYRHLKKWAKRTETNAFRIYDRDIKEYPLAIDLYGESFCVQYFSYDRDSDEPPEELVEEINEILNALFSAESQAIFWRSRIRRKRTEQYERRGSEEKFFPVYEYGVKFWVNLVDYLDTGLFLDHRETRQMVAKLASGKQLLNLFAYTCSFSVQAAAKGAASTTSVDLSNSYTEWGSENFKLNDLSLKNNQIIRADCMKFLSRERGRYDVIVIDPPTISRSKKMEGMFDVQQDYATVISQALDLLNDGGTLFFSTNFRGFKFDETLFPGYAIREITDKTIPEDFHQKKIHRCWKFMTG